MKLLAALRKIRACEGEAAAQLVLERFAADCTSSALRNAADEFDADGEYAGHGIHLRRLADELTPPLMG